jgi:hypothetical protein
VISACLNRKPEELPGEKEVPSASIQRISVMFGLNLGKLHSQPTCGLMASERTHPPQGVRVARLQGKSRCVASEK